MKVSFIVLFILFITSTKILSHNVEDYIRASFYTLNGDYKKAYKYYKRSLTYSPNPKVYSKLFFSALYENNTAEAEKLLIEGLEIFPDSSLLYYNLGSFYYMLLKESTNGSNLYDADTMLYNAISSYKKSISIEPTELAYSSLTEVLIEHELYKDAVEIVSDMISIYGPHYYVLRGYIFLCLNMYEDAKKDFSEGIKIGDVKSYYHMALLSYNEGKVDEAISLLNDIYDNGESLYDASLLLSNIYTELGRWDEALRILIYLKSNLDDQSKGNILLNIASILIDKGENIEALSIYKEYLQYDKTNPKIFMLASTIAETINDSETESIYLEALTLYPNFTALRKNLAMYYIYNGSFKKALETLTTIDSVEQDVEYYRILAYIYDGLNDFDNITRVLRYALRENPGDVVLSYYYADAYCERAVDIDDYNFNKCIEVLKISIEQNPESHELLNYLGYFYADNNINLQDANELIDKALIYSPGNYAYLDSKAWVLYRLGDYKGAYEYIKKAYEMYPDMDEIKEHLYSIEKKIKNEE